ncbi:RNA polymerase sigma-70 factor [Chitinophaga niabensis]|uniref:RNA polymerase sigma-70 factor, ECF subfamily n=1 Tax=Chitinophaga niabensis TaxID=536979 RepID=A0A1N6G9H4_9BACT|nr:RNA polymerase sigma-70 factor [Chitinophaga niabensis]SIO04144.1 RNA polymerase sigma-70 factor, ECF subfamily [Chitinophaga niabensis]
MQIFPLEVIFNEYYERLVYFSLKILDDKQDAEDAVQEAFVRYWNNKDNVSQELHSIRSYLYAAVKSISLNVIRHRQVVKNFEQQALSPAAENQIINNIIQAEVLTKICKAMATLPDACRRISRMGYIDGMKNLEIAKELGISVNTVKSQKLKGLKILRMKLIPDLIVSIYLLAMNWP